MSDTRYPTRMHEVLGVETGELFSIYAFADAELAYVDTNGNVLSAKNNEPVGPYTLTVAINRGIIRKPRLSEEQVKQLRALVTLGFRWLIKNRDCSAFAYTYMPEKMDAWWEGANADVQIFIDLPTGVLYDLVSWSDPAPLDIVATLKSAGVEVE